MPQPSISITTTKGTSWMSIVAPREIHLVACGSCGTGTTRSSGLCHPCANPQVEKQGDAWMVDGELTTTEDLLKEAGAHEPWIGFDLDGTLAKAQDKFDPDSVGEPIDKMMEVLQGHLDDGDTCKIMTARAAEGGKRAAEVIQDWLEEHGKPRLEVTNEKDPGMVKLYDDRAVSVKTDEGVCKEAVVKQEGGKWVLYTKDGSRVLGRHNSAKAAYAQEYAIRKSEERREKSARDSEERWLRLCARRGQCPECGEPNTGELDRCSCPQEKRAKMIARKERIEYDDHCPHCDHKFHEKGYPRPKYPDDADEDQRREIFDSGDYDEHCPKCDGIVDSPEQTDEEIAELEKSWGGSWFNGDDARARRETRRKRIASRMEKKADMGWVNSQAEQDEINSRELERARQDPDYVANYDGTMRATWPHVKHAISVLKAEQTKSASVSEPSAEVLMDRPCCGMGCENCPYEPQHVLGNTNLQERYQEDQIKRGHVAQNRLSTRRPPGMRRYLLTGDIVSDAYTTPTKSAACAAWPTEYDEWFSVLGKFGALRKSAVDSDDVPTDSDEVVDSEVGLDEVGDPPAEDDVVASVGQGGVATVRTDPVGGTPGGTPGASAVGASRQGVDHGSTGVIAQSLLGVPDFDKVANNKVARPPALLAAATNISEDRYKRAFQRRGTLASSLGLTRPSAFPAASDAGDGSVSQPVLLEALDRVGAPATGAGPLAPGGLVKRSSSLSAGCGRRVGGVGPDCLKERRGSQELPPPAVRDLGVVGALDQAEPAAHGVEPLVKLAGSPAVLAGLGDPGKVDLFVDGAEILSKVARYRRFQTAQNNPSKSQVQANNYRMGHVNFRGLDITIENEKGSVRRGVSDSGKKWESTLTCPYGYIRSAAGGKSGVRARPRAADGDHLDVFIGPNKESEFVVVIDQFFNDEYDESKFILGCGSQKEAVKLYRSNYQRGWPEMPVSTTTIPQLRGWLKDGDHTKPFKGQMVKAARSRYC